jgi:hypothetical protein
MKKKTFLLFSIIAISFRSYAQTVVPQLSPAGGPLSSGGAWLNFATGGSATSIQENWGLNLTGTSIQPVRVYNASLLVGYQGYGQDFGVHNAYISGNVGIGTTNARAVFDVGKLLNMGEISAVLARLPEGDGVGTGTYLGVKGYATQINTTFPTLTDVKSFSIEHSFYGSTNSSINFMRGTSDIGGSIAFNTNNNSEKMRIDANGYVGVGTKTPDARLTVNGTIHSKEVKVDLNVPGPDYVFNEDYKLITLAEIKDYVAKNRHLPEIPSAAQMAKEGINLGDMNTKLLRR